jgi:hypothetical protein
MGLTSAINSVSVEVSVGFSIRCVAVRVAAESYLTEAVSTLAIFGVLRFGA